jgi:hypothetical protein
MMSIKFSMLKMLFLKKRGKVDVIVVDIIVVDVIAVDVTVVGVIVVDVVHYWG